MHHQKSMELMKDFDFEWKYYPKKTNKVVDALAQKEMHTAELMMLEHNLLERFQDLDLHLTWTQAGFLINQMSIMCDLR